MKTRKMILRNLVVALLLIITVIPVYAQRGEKGMERREKVRTYKIGYLTNKLDLTDEEAQQFWPVYNAHEKAVQEKSNEFRKKHNFTPDDIENLNESDAQQFITDQLNHEQEMLDLKKKFISDLKGIIPEKKILILLEAEKQFRNDLMRRLASERRKGTPPPPYNRK